MSKQPSNQAKRNLLRRGLAGILSLALILGLLPGSVLSAGAASWADPYVETLVDWGVMRGDIGGNMAPDRSITRAEFVAMMNRAYGYTRLGGHPFTDVRTRDWYNQDIDIGYNIGYFKGTSPTTASPNDTLTREQAAVLLARNMMLQETVGETLGFSDSRSLSDWSRGLVGAAAAQGIISGYGDGTFKPFNNITRGEVAAMLVRAIGTPIQTEGEHALGNVYGNVTVNTSGVKLRDGTIVGNLYLTGGIDLGDVLLENVNVLGEIIVSGGGESNSSAASIVMRNVTADNMIVDSIADQFVTIRAEGVTDIPTTTVRTNAYVDDSSLPGYGLSYIELDGDEGTLLQLAGNVKEVWNKTPGSNLQVVQGSAEKVTVDEDAVGSSVLVDGDARVDDLNLDTATTVTGTGDIKNLNVGAAGSTVEQLPDKIEIRPGITADVNGGTMNSSQAAESSADPKLLAGYPAVKNIAPNSATLVFRTNKTGTIYWAVSAVADGSVKEADLLEPPVYGGNVLQSGTISATSANTDFTAAVTGLTKDGSYYVTAMLVDGRDQHSPIKVTSFSTPDDTVPAFNQGYPYMSRITTENSQVTVSTNKSCLLYYALLPKGSTAPTPAEFKANAITGNLGYGTIDTVKNVTQPFQVNSTRLKELTDYTLYLWLTDHDGAKSSAVITLDFTTPDEQPPVIIDPEQTNASANSVEVTFQLNEAGTLYWAAVPEGERYESSFEGISTEDWDPDEVNDPDDRRVQIKIENGAGNTISSGNARVNAGYTNGRAQVTGLDPTQYGHSFTLYLVAKDAAGNYSKIQKIHIKTRDTERPRVTQEFNPANEEKPNEPPANTDVRLVFSERVQGLDKEDLLDLYRKVNNATDPKEKGAAMNDLAQALHKYIKLYYGVTGNSTANDRNEVNYVAECDVAPDGSIRYGATVNGVFEPNTDWVINYCKAVIEEPDKDGNMVVVFPTDRVNADKRDSALNLNSGATYHFVVEDIVDMAEDPNDLNPNPTRLLEFTTQAARVVLTPGDTPSIVTAYDGTGKDITSSLTPSDKPDDAKNKNDPRRIDYIFQMNPMDVEKADKSLYWDMLFWFEDANVTFTLYSRPINGNGDPINPATGSVYTNPDNAPWTQLGTMSVGRGSFQSYKANIPSKTTQPTYDLVQNMLKPVDANGAEAEDGKAWKEQKEYAIHLDRLENNPDFTGWNFEKVTMRVSVVAGDRNQLAQLVNGGYENAYNSAISNGVRAIETPSPFRQDRGFSDRGQPEIKPPNISISDDGAEVTFQMTKRGQVYYMAIPLSRLSIKNVDQDANELTEAIVRAVDSYYCPLTFLEKETDTDKPALNKVPLMEGDPDKRVTTPSLPSPLIETVAKPDYTDFTRGGELGNGIIRGTTTVSPSETSYISIDLEGRLEANTVYLLCLLPCGVSAVPNDESKVWAYRFTTDMEEIPKLELSGINNPTIVANVNEKSYIDYFLVTYGKEGDPFNKVLFKTIADPTKWDTFTPATSGLDKDTMTVLQAMTDYQREGTGRFLGTSFDLYAKEGEKGTYVELIQAMSSFTGGNDNILTGARGREPVSSLTMPFGENIGSRQDDYTVVAMARRNSDSTRYSFCAWYKVHGSSSTPPMIQDAMVTGLRATTDSTSSVTSLSGTLTLSFDKPLYRWVDSGVYVGIDDCDANGHAGSTDGTKDNCYALGNGVTTTSTSVVYTGGKHQTPALPTQNITLQINNIPIGSSDGITFGRYRIVDKDGNDNGRSPLSISVRAVNKGTADSPIYRFEVTTNSNWTIAGWDNNLA